MPNVIPCHTSRQHCFCLMLLGVLFHPCKSVPNTMTRLRCDKQSMEQNARGNKKALDMNSWSHGTYRMQFSGISVMTHLRISLRFFFSHLRGWSLDQLGKNSKKTVSECAVKVTTWKSTAKTRICCRCLRYLHISPHIISTRMLVSQQVAKSAICTLAKLHPEVSAESRLSNLSPLPIRHPDVLKRWNWHLGCGIHTDFFEALLWLAYICLYWYYTDSNDTMLNLWLKIQSSNHPIRINSSGKDSVQPFGWFALPTLGSERLSGVLGTAGTASRLPNTAPWALGASWRKASSW